MKKTISITLIVIWMAVILWFSSMPGDESNIKSKSTIKEALNIVTSHEKLDKAKETMNDSIQNQTENNLDTRETQTMPKQQNSQQKQQEEQLIEKLNKPLRKCMHASVYFVLSILIFNCLKTFKISG